ncbi:hypothetical protein C479_12284 [Halovivax asiaticus JCM 14624]|uniref:BNR repeat-containing glycosyl hydrolase n=1 Tax=Halovivax asiaticus JCM 14624 TaxID=1227490 RepID=M0BF24_9EURY|nr:hypothetical protein [Halovivax asiaticus]ELZ08903.1 hypothetical protein C479_12284 [Halovivax asiaticus JCM 14624]
MDVVHLALPDTLLTVAGTGADASRRPRSPDAGRLECVASPPTDPTTVFLGTFEDGAVRLTDDTIEALDVGAGDAVMALAISPHDPAVVYAGTEPSRLYRSQDGGETWTHLAGLADVPSEPEWFFPPRPDTHHVRWIEIDPFDPDRLYVGIEAGAFLLSTDGGEGWQERPPGARRDNHSLATHPDRKGLVYAAAGDGFARSTDGGETWEHPQVGLDHRYCWSVVADPGDPESVLVSAASGASQAHRQGTAESYVYRLRSEDAWERLEETGLPTGDGVVRTVFATTDDPGVVYGANNTGLYRSSDFGDSWRPVPIEWDDAFETQTPRGIVVR